MKDMQALNVMACPQLGMELLSHSRGMWPKPGYRHVHESLQVLVLFSGKSDVLWEGSAQAEPWQTDQIVVMPPGLAHQVETTGSRTVVEFLDMRIDLAHRGELARAWPAHAQQPRVLQGQTHANMLARDMLTQAVTMQAAARDHALQAIGWLLLTQVSCAIESSQQRHVNHRLLLAERLMAERIANPMSVAALAQACDLSVSQLNRLYSQHQRTTPARRMMALRLAHARELLPASLLTLKQIARECGFVCVNHFSRVFRQHVGMTPGEYRKQRQPPIPNMRTSTSPGATRPSATRTGHAM